MIKKYLFVGMSEWTQAEELILLCYAAANTLPNGRIYWSKVQEVLLDRSRQSSISKYGRLREKGLEHYMQ